MTVPKSHPRYHSLLIRDRLVSGIESGITSEVGLIAHGRGEAFDYLIGERTTDSAMRATEAAVAMLASARNPVLSVNGNVAALVPGGIVELGRILDAKIEINLFYRTSERVHAIADHLRAHGASRVLGERPDTHLNAHQNALPKSHPNPPPAPDSTLPLDNPRSLVCEEGIGSADVVLVPLEDGDRCHALVEMGKSVIAIDLNPLSRTAQTATITIVDNVVRTIPAMIKIARRMKDLPADRLDEIVSQYDNRETIASAIGAVCSGYSEKSWEF